MITFNRLGQLGRLGNQLFQIASTVGISIKNNQEYGFNEWKYSEFFENKLPALKKQSFSEVKEKHYHYCNYEIKNNVSLDGYFQSEKYFNHCVKEIRDLFDFKNDIVKKCLSYLPNNGKQNIAVHIRRGDYVGNPSHYNLSIRYYINALEEIGCFSSNIIFFSDDINFAKWHFSCLPNSYFVHNSEIEDLCTMSLCDNFIIANSSFSWWGAWLSKNINKIVIRPEEHFAGNQLKHNICDFYPTNWIKVSDNNKIKLFDTTFIIPIKFDHNDRMANLNLSIQHLQTDFDTIVHVIEQGSTKFSYVEDFADYTFCQFKDFHRTRMINKTAKFIKTPYCVNYDADILLNPVQIWYSVMLLRNGYDIIYPYDGNFKNIPRSEHILLSKNLYHLINNKYNGPTESCGGAIFMNRLSFLDAGGENEYFISWGPEDAERFSRFTKLGLKVIRVNGPIYHLQHFRGSDSGRSNKFLEANRKEWHKIRLMKPDELKSYIQTWPWM